MDKDILNQLKINLEQIENKRKKALQKELEKTNKNTERMYYEMWKQILKHMKTKEEFEVMFRFGDFIQLIEVDDIPRKAIICNKINRQKLYNTFKNDGLLCSYVGSPATGLMIFIKRNELKKIQESHEVQKKLK